MLNNLLFWEIVLSRFKNEKCLAGISSGARNNRRVLGGATV